ncbi:MAG: DEAD/DEAH box helicase [Eubacteriales bacterium]|nr:DEAD/DEAH box helicase [Eubacteriales bacterium]
MKDSLYSWQEDCLREWFRQNGRGLVEAVTGSGKTRLALEASRRLTKTDAASHKDGSLLFKIVVPTAALQRQWSKALREFLAPQEAADIGLWGGGHHSHREKKYMIYVINSARYTLARQILEDLKRGDRVFLIADECHHYASGENQRIFDFYPFLRQYEGQYFSLGLSATLPQGEARTFLVRSLGHCIYRYGIRRALQNQTICKYDIYHIQIPFEPKERNQYDDLTTKMTDLYKRLLRQRPELSRKSLPDFYKELEHLASGKNPQLSKMALQYMRLTYRRRTLVCLAKYRLACALQLIRLLGVQEKILVFGERICQAEELYQSLEREFPHRVGRYHSQMGDLANKNVLERFRNGDIRILITCRSLDEGIDIPETAIGIILSGTSRQRQRIQRLGRIIRKAQGKECASLYYLHLDETSEDSVFLPDCGENPIFELTYLPEREEFYNPSYRLAAEAAWKELGGIQAGEKVQKEFFRCIEAGSVRDHWLRDPAWLKDQLNGTKNLRERNYWSCMKRLRSHKKPTKS